MIDIHAHILHGLDDGAATLNEAIGMADLAAADGIRTVVATPHFDIDFLGAADALADRVSLMLCRLDELRTALAAKGNPLEVLAGCEAYVSLDLPDRAARGEVPTLNGSRYLLIEWPLRQRPTYGEQVIFRLQVSGLVPVLAHAERYAFVQDDVNELIKLIERGVLVQVSSCSLLGVFGPKAQRTAEAMLRHDLAQVLATDAHSLYGRAPTLRSAVVRSAELIGEERARALVEGVPTALLADRPIHVEPPVRCRGRPFWAFWR